MTSKTPTTGETEEVKTCTTCGGTWPTDRPICPACGASLTNIAAQPATSGESAADFDWQWLDALAPEQDEQPQTSGEGKGKQAKGAWWQFWR
jgi:hypothetical protein